MHPHYLTNSMLELTDLFILNDPLSGTTTKYSANSQCDTRTLDPQIKG
jgi:hypothetical protein